MWAAAPTSKSNSLNPPSQRYSEQQNATYFQKAEQLFLDFFDFSFFGLQFGDLIRSHFDEAALSLPIIESLSVVWTIC